MGPASSVVKSLAALALYLKTTAEKGDFVVIDEPEMNAHPESQLAIAELLAMMVNRGINVLITTHSPYIVDHLNNLTEASKLPADRRESVVKRLKLGSEEAILPPESVATYLFDTNGKVTDIYNRDEGIIDWGTFGGESDWVGNLYADILTAGSPEGR